MIRVFFVVLSASFLLFVSACSQDKTASAAAPPTADSDIVRKVEASGAGDVSAVSPQALEQWFTHHTNVAVEIAQACTPIRKSANAAWGDTLEAKVCNAAVAPATFAPITVKGSGKKY
ncbi:MAG TPA: hypothetical protein VFK06_25605 [Candidatus Angelobacter sp.]|nr:hypothetical protein [Candidatus Angelobacter sp.]